MSYRPTISVCYDGKIADIGYYRNWSDSGLLYEAVLIYAHYVECKTIKEYREKRFHSQNVIYSLEPEKFENTEENLRMLESCSELPVVLDMTQKCIYCRENGGNVPDDHVIGKGWQEPLRIPLKTNSDFYKILRNYKVMLDHVDVQEVLQIEMEIF